MNKPATDKAAAPAVATTEAAERSLIEEVLRQTPQIPSPQFAVPKNWTEVEALAKRICDAGWCPKSHRDKQGKPNQASVELAILQGMEVGVAPVMAVQGIAIINGVPAIWGDLMLAVVTASGLLEFKDEFIEGKGDDMRAVCRVKRTTRPNTVRREFSVAMAKRAQLSGKAGPWQGYPSRMLAMRARSWALRDEFADVLRGMASMEELRDAGALDRAIAATEGQGGTAQDITAALKGEPGAGVDLSTGDDRTVRVTSEKTADGSTKVLAVDEVPPGSDIDPETGEILPAGTAGPSGEGAKINTPGKSIEAAGDDLAVEFARETGQAWLDRKAKDGITTPAPSSLDPDAVKEGSLPAETRDLLDRAQPASKHSDETAAASTASQPSGHQPDESEWAEAVPAMLDRIDDATSIADLEVIVASNRIKPDLDKMAAAAPQQHGAVVGFIEEKRKELGG